MSSRESWDVLIVGAGHGGAQTAIALRQRGFSGSIALVGEEPDLPYERPPLSKEYLAGAKPFDRMLIRPPAFWAERDVAMLLGRKVAAIDPRAHTVTTEAREEIGYGTLVWAAGGHARPLACSGHALAGVHSIRCRADVDRLSAELSSPRQVCIVGGGYIGLEAAAALIGLGHKVTLVEAQDRVLARVAGPTLSRFFESEHRARGLDLRLAASVDCIEEKDGRAAALRLADSTLLPCNLVVVGIGIVPAVAPLLAAGAEGGDGVAVDDHGRTSLPDVFAIGDCARHPNPFAGGAAIRLESVQNANDMAGTVARAITGDPAPYEALPWFWSNQYDLRLQTVGLSAGHDTEVTRGDPASRSFSVIYLKQGRVIALDCVNNTRDFAQGRALVLARAEIPPAPLADPGTPLKELLSAGPAAPIRT